MRWWSSYWCSPRWRHRFVERWHCCRIQW
jgi:hypothetical protein